MCMRIGPTEAQVLPCAPTRNNVSLPSYRGAEDSGDVTLMAQGAKQDFIFRIFSFYFFLLFMFLQKKLGKVGEKQSIMSLSM